VESDTSQPLRRNGFYSILRQAAVEEWNV
jgi:hypothetical protein